MEKVLISCQSTGIVYCEHQTCKLMVIVL